MRMMVLTGLLLAGCASTLSDAPVTSWGKAEVPMSQFLADASHCMEATAAVRAPTEVLVQSRIGGVPSSAMSDDVDTAPHSWDALMDAAEARRNAQAHADLRARQAAHNECLRDRGYTQFRLTEAQRRHFDALPSESLERRVYLHQLGADHAVLEAQAL